MYYACGEEVNWGGEIGVCCDRIAIEVVSLSILWNKSDCFSLARYRTNEISTRRLEIVIVY